MYIKVIIFFINFSTGYKYINNIDVNNSIEYIINLGTSLNT